MNATIDRAAFGGPASALGRIAAAPALASAQPFAASLAGALETARPPASTEARVAAEKLVATVFVEPILERMRGDLFTAERFTAGTAEKRFGPIFDQTLADRIVSRPGFPLVDAVERHLRELAGQLPAGAAGDLR